MSTGSVSAMVRMRNIWKRFPGVIANQGIAFELRVGEVHALLGENGAGKTTLMNILAGSYRSDEGEIWVRGERVEIHSPMEAIQLGIGMVHQNFRLVDNLTVAENVHLGWSETPWHISRTDISNRLEKIAAELNYKVDPNAQIWQLSVGEQQRVEILKVLARGAKVLILDEPTAVLTPLETRELFSALRAMAEMGRSVVFISHKLDEVLDVSDRITVLRNGLRVETVKTEACNDRMLAQLMVGKTVAFQNLQKRGTPGGVILELEGVNANNDRGLPALRDFDLTIKRGEILGIAGVAGNGQRELVEIITGLRQLESGKVVLEGVDLTGGSPSVFADAGVGHIPEDRVGMGLFPDLAVSHNAILRKYREPPIRKGVRIITDAAVEFTKGLVARGDVRLPNLNVKVQTLSGGNQQKLLVRREIEIASKLLVAVHPTRGLDVAASEDVRMTLIDHRNQGNGVLLVSEDLDEIFLLSDRVTVIYDGRLVGEFDIEEAQRDDIGLLMGGSSLVQEEVL